MKPIRLTSIPCALALFSSSAFLAAHELRPLSTDRPDTTESPHSVDQGHWQMETEIVSWTRDGGDWTSTSISEMNLKYGVSESSDLQLVLPIYTRLKHGDEGFGDIQVRLKHNLWGNDTEGNALAIMPYVKLPTARGDLGNGDLEGGVALPYAMDGPAGWSIGLMGQLDIVSDEDGDGMLGELLVSAAIGHGLTENTALFLETAALFTPESSSEHEAWFNTGLTWAQSGSVQWDAGIRVGLTSATTDFSPFLGISMKF